MVCADALIFIKNEVLFEMIELREFFAVNFHFEMSVIYHNKARIIVIFE